MHWLDTPDHVFDVVYGIKAYAELNRPGAEALFSAEARTLPEVFAAAKAGKLRSFRLNKTVSIQYRARHTPVISMNVVGVLPGSDSTLSNEYVVFTAHLDHLGIGPSVKGDSIYNGALDNAAGSSVMLEVARFFSALPSAPARSVAFVAVCGEEQDLLGSQAFANHSPLPGPIVANINVDGGAFIVPIRDVVAYGEEHSSLGLLARRAASDLTMELSPDPFPDEGLFVRSDQYSFVRAGIPSLQIDLGFKSEQSGVDPLAEIKKWLVTIYHSPQDDTSQPIHYESSAQFTRFASLLSYYTASLPKAPVWNANDFFVKRFASR